VSAQVHIPSFLQDFTNGVAVVSVDGNTVGDCLANLVGRFPHLRQWLFTKNGKLHQYVEILLNGQSSYPEELAKSVKDGDEIHILNIIAGG
jgi:molybdopterin converting factor small subunit